MLVAEDLHLDVPTDLDVLLHEHGGVPEGRPGLAGGLLQGLHQLLGVVGDADAPPPPPAVAFTITGYPISSATASASASPSTSPSEPGIVGTPAFFIRALEASFIPIARIASGLGPMKAMFHWRQASAKNGFSARKP